MNNPPNNPPCCLPTKTHIIIFIHRLLYARLALYVFILYNSLLVLDYYVAYAAISKNDSYPPIARMGQETDTNMVIDEKFSILYMCHSDVTKLQISLCDT